MLAGGGITSKAGGLRSGGSLSSTVIMIMIQIQILIIVIIAIITIFVMAIVIMIMMIINNVIAIMVCYDYYCNY